MTAQNWTRFHIRLGILACLYAAFQCFVFAPPAVAADSHVQIVTFDSWVEVPGSVLPGGRYLFRENDVTPDKHQVLIYDYVTGILVANLPTIPQQLEKSVEGNIRYESRPGPFQGNAVAEWIRPGSRLGEQFIYSPGMTIGEATVPATAADMQPVTADLTAAPDQPSAAETTAAAEPITTPPAEAAPVNSQAQQQAAQPTTAQQTPDQTTPATSSSPAASTPDSTNEEPGTMPKTASEMPLIAAIGACAFALAGLLYLRGRIVKSA
jgi:hypothetical protein